MSEGQPATFEMPLQAGHRVFWSTINPTACGHLRTKAAPEFCLGPDFAGPTADMTKGYWDLWPIDNPARPHPLEETKRLCRPVRITARTPAVGRDVHGIAVERERGVMAGEGIIVRRDRAVAVYGF
jgi:hypothetical protein